MTDRHAAEEKNVYERRALAAEAHNTKLLTALIITEAGLSALLDATKGNPAYQRAIDMALTSRDMARAAIAAAEKGRVEMPSGFNASDLDTRDIAIRQAEENTALRARIAELLAALKTVRCWGCGEKTTRSTGRGVSRMHWEGCALCGHLVAAIAAAGEGE